MIKEKIVKIEKSNRKNKKYKAVIQSMNGKKRIIHFGNIHYEHYRDITPLKLYSYLNHNDKIRRVKYYMRFSKSYNKTDALKKEWEKSNHKYNAKILSHKFLW